MGSGVHRPTFADVVPLSPERDHPLSVIQRILLTTDGTVTSVLQAYAGEPVATVRLSQSVLESASDFPELGPGPIEGVMERSVILRGSRSGTNLLYAESLIVPDRLHPRVLDGLLFTDEPIGRLLATNRIETFREFVSWSPEPAGRCAHHFGIPSEETLLSRSYRILSERQPIMFITEKFPATSFSSC